MSGRFHLLHSSTPWNGFAARCSWLIEWSTAHLNNQLQQPCPSTARKFTIYLPLPVAARDCEAFTKSEISLRHLTQATRRGGLSRNWDSMVENVLCTAFPQPSTLTTWQYLLFHIAVYPIMLIYFNPGISLIFIGILEFIFIFNFLICWASIIIYYLDWRDSSWWTWIGQTAIGGNGMGISTKWFFSFVSFHCDRFMNSTSQPLLNGSCDFETFFWHLY